MKQQNDLTVNFNRDVFYFSDTALCDVPFHCHDFRTIVLVLSGNVIYSIEGKTYSLQPYDIALIDIGEIHSVDSLDRSTYKRIVFYLRENSDLNYIFEKAYKRKLSILRTSYSPTSNLYMMCQKLEKSLSTQTYGKLNFNQFPFFEFLRELHSTFLSDCVPYLNIYLADRRIVYLLTYIREHLSEEFTIESLAEELEISDCYFMHLFKNQVGCSLGNYMTQKRLIFAKFMVESGASITTACFDCGFKNYSTFFRCYKKLFGKAPVIEKQNHFPKTLFENLPS